MEPIKSTDSLEEYQKKMSHNRRIVMQAQAVLKRSEQAGIPPKYQRINRDTFCQLLDPSYHDDVEAVSDFIYKSPLSLLKKECIVIDGGGTLERKLAVYAILFRLIACDQYGSYILNNNLCHQLQDMRPNYDGLYRNEITGRLRNMDVIAISEILIGDFRKGFDTGRYYDDFLSYRDDYVKTTILSFGKPLAQKQAHEQPQENTWEDQERFGQYICSAAQSDQTKSPNFFRIRVRIRMKKNG